MTRFGNIISADLLEDDLTTFLQRWILTYLGEVAEQNGESRNRYPRPKYWTTTPILTIDSVAQIRYPATLIVSPGLVGKPVRRGDGSYEATYQIGVCVLCSTKDEAGTTRMARRYGAAIHSAVLQKPSLETDYIIGVEWADERFTDFLNADQETVASATEIFNVTIAGLFDAHKGPGPKYPDPLPEPATAPNEEYTDLPSTRDPDSAPPYSPIPPSVTPLP
jgi:hypothetical protein